MFKKWSKKAKLATGIAIFVLAVAIGVGAWSFSTGKISSQADTYVFPGSSGGKLMGTVSGEGACGTNLANTEITLMDNSNPDVIKVIANVNANTDGTYAFRNVPLNKPLIVAAFKSCTHNGHCQMPGEGTIKFTSNGQIITKNVTFSLGTGGYKILTKVKRSGYTYGKCVNAGGTWLQETDCLFPLPSVSLKITDIGGDVQIGKSDIAGVYPMASGQALATAANGPISIVASKTGYKTTTAQTTIEMCSSQKTTVQLLPN